MNLVTRTLILILAGFGVYKMFPQVAGPVDYYVKNPKFLEGVIRPVVQTANSVLPSKLQIPESDVLGAQTTTYAESPLKTITDEVGKKVASAAADQVVVIKNAATNQVCEALLQKLQSECGQ